MAAAFLDSIINETLRKSFGGSDHLENSVLNGLQQERAARQYNGLGGPEGSRIASQFTAPNSLQTIMAGLNDDQLDSLTQSLQNFEMSQYERLFWVLIFSIMVVIAAGGNIIVAYIVSTNKEMKSVTNYFLVNLSMADTMVSTLNVIFNFISMLNR